MTMATPHSHPQTPPTKPPTHITHVPGGRASLEGDGRQLPHLQQGLPVVHPLRLGPKPPRAGGLPNGHLV